MNATPVTLSEEKKLVDLANSMVGIMRKAGEVMKPSNEARVVVDALTNAYLWTRLYIDNLKAANFDPKMEAKLRKVEKVSESEKH